MDVEINDYENKENNHKNVDIHKKNIKLNKIPIAKKSPTASTSNKLIKKDKQSNDLTINTLEDDSTPKKKPFSFSNFITRTITTFLLLGSFYVIIRAGHLYCILLVVIIQAELYRELVNVRYVEAKQKKMPWFRSLQWGWFIAPMLYVYGQHFHKFCIEHRNLNYLAKITKYTTQVSFLLYCLLFVLSILTLKPNLIKYQISQYMWSIVTVCLVVFQCNIFAWNTLNGLFWFIFPVSTVIFNDISAYLCGISLGRRFIKKPFLALSPNKT